MFWWEAMLGMRICAASREWMRNKWPEGPGTAGTEGVDGGVGNSEQEISVRVEESRGEQARRSRPGLLLKPMRTEGQESMGEETERCGRLPG